jgi:hypothetical protein
MLAHIVEWYNRGIFDAPENPWLHRSNLVLTPPHTPKRGQFDLNHPLKDVASKMPLILSLLLPAQKAEHKSRKKCTNIPEVTGQCNTMF